NIEASDRLSAEDFIRIDNEIQEFGNVEITDEDIISHVRPTAESESGDELSIVNQRITTKEALEYLNIAFSYIQDPPENLTFEFKNTLIQ
ncbi:5909_t:CDS:1, partial [Entrophospora sp. SA101]